MATMLVVAEQQSQIHQLQQALNKHTLTMTRSVQHALDLLRERNFDAIVAVTHLQNSDVFELLSQAKADAHLSSTPIILYCAEPSERALALHDTVKAAAVALGAQGYITMRAFDAKLLREQVEICMNQTDKPANTLRADEQNIRLPAGTQQQLKFHS